MGRAQEYLQHAEDAEKRARKAISPLEREAYEKIARSWRQLADEAERRERH